MQSALSIAAVACAITHDTVSDPRFKDDLARGDNGEALSAIMQKWCDSRTVAEALEALEANRIPAGAIYTPQQALDDVVCAGR